MVRRLYGPNEALVAEAESAADSKAVRRKFQRAVLAGLTVNALIRSHHLKLQQGAGAGFNDSYRRRSLKQKAQELAACVVRNTPIADGSSHWQETALLWDAVANGNREWSVPAYDGGLFTSDPQVSPVGAQLAGTVVANATFEAALRALLVIETAEGVPGPVDFRSLGVREFGTIYEGLLESELALADTDLALNKQGAYMPARAKDHVAVSRGEVYLHNRSGARKSSGSYYTKQFAVEHLLDGSLQPALEDHFARLGDMDDADAAEAFFDFRVADIAMGTRFELFVECLSFEQLASERGAVLPTLKQVEKLASATHAPVRYFFLAEPPEESLPIPDLRTVGSLPVSRPSRRAAWWSSWTTSTA